MAKPPPAGPSTDIHGNDQHFHAGVPNRDPANGSGEAKHEAEQESAGRPPQTTKKPGGDGPGA